MSANKPSGSPPPPDGGIHFFHGTKHSQFENMTLNNVGRNQTHDHRGWSSDTIHHDSRRFETINGGYTENDHRQMDRNIENVHTYHEYQGSHGNSTSEYLKIFLLEYFYRMKISFSFAIFI